ncbi:MAG: flagellar motor protein MotB [Oscillospiraceae bacterium]|jgi:chemotaxis protein MotB|nr:flagellar motor protein MotB [Oscillospiraceae bacterium]
MAKKKSSPTIKKGLDEWMATYADMVTLLFCFFVMLYSASNQDEARFQYILQAFSTGGRYINTIVGPELDPPLDPQGPNENTNIPPQAPGDSEGNHPGTTNEPHLFDSLFSQIAELVESLDLSGVQVYSSPGLIRILLSDDVLFDGDSYVLKDEGRRILDLFVPAIRAQDDYIASVQIQGYTADVHSPTGMNDWDLSSMRASTVVRHLDEVRKMVQTTKFSAEGLGIRNPIGDNSTPEGRAQNRRVEIIINRNELTDEENRFVDDILRYDYNNPFQVVDPHGRPVPQPGTPVESIVAGIIGDLLERYGDRSDPSSSSPGGTPIGPNPGGFTGVTDSDFLPPGPITPPVNGENGENGTNGAETND